MSEKKLGFFKRLFGSNEKSDAPEKPVLEETHIDAGPPETGADWVKDEIHPNADPAPTVATPEAPDHEEHPHDSPAPPEATISPELAVEEIAVVEELTPETVAEVTPEPEGTEPELNEAADIRLDVSTEGSVADEKKSGWFKRMATGLKRTSDQLSDNIGAVFTKSKLDDATLEELEDVLIQADLGVDVAMSITEILARDKFDKEISTDDVRAILAEEVEKVLEPVAVEFEIDSAQKPFVILMIGVNGSGKTTTIGKLSEKFSDEGHKVLLAAGDTFRAAAIEQLQIWGDRTNTPVISRPAGSDASGLAFDAVKQAQEDGSDVLIIDTAGRLQNRDELMAELEKIIRVIKKVDASAPHAVLLTLDATTGQNALQQVEIFGKRAGVTGLIMTKLDGTARGGILVAIAKKYALPVHFIGVGEGVDDLESFVPGEFAFAIAGTMDDNFYDEEDQ